MARRRGASVQLRGVPHRLPVHCRADVRGRLRPEGRRRQPREAQDGARRVRGAPVQAQVPRGRLRQPRGPQPLPEHSLPHGHALQVGPRRVPARQGVVGEHRGAARRQESRRPNAVAGVRELARTAGLRHLFRLVVVMKCKE